MPMSLLYEEGANQSFTKQNWIKQENGGGDATFIQNRPLLQKVSWFNWQLFSDFLHFSFVGAHSLGSIIFYPNTLWEF